MDIKGIEIIKKDGSKEKFEPKKIERVLKAAGLNDEQSQQVADEITEWVINNSEFGVSSQDIRRMVYEKLQQVDEYTANFYKWYKKTEGKETSSPTSEN